MKLVGGDWIISMDTAEMDDLEEAVCTALALFDEKIEQGNDAEDWSAHAKRLFRFYCLLKRSDEQ